MTYAWQALESSERAVRMMEQAPPEYGWGCRVSEDFVLSTEEVAFWFSCPHEMVTWFAEDEDLDARFDEARRAALWTSLRSLADTSLSGTSILPTCATVRLLLDRRWLARYVRGLCGGSSETARELRGDFRDDAGRPRRLLKTK